MTNKKRMLSAVILVAIFITIFSIKVNATGVVPIPRIGIDIGTSEAPKEVATSIQVFLMLTVLSLAPSILLMMTSFTRIIIVLSFVRNAIGTQQMPPNQVLIGLALFLSLFVMSPVINDINENAYKPYVNEEITQEVGLERASQTIKDFMLRNVNDDDLGLFISLSGIETPIPADEIQRLPLTIIIPAFLISELAIAFKIGFLIFIPFIVIDMVVASTLMSMGMMMLPPVMISLPFKILLFIMIGGWNIVSQSLIKSFS